MYGSTPCTVVLCLTAIFAASYAANTRFQTLDLDEGAVCRTEGSKRWTCKDYRTCSKAREAHLNGKPVVLCRQNRGVPTVCCEPDEAPSRKVGDRAKQMCAKYAENVFSYYPDPMVDGKQLKVDHCNLLEPLVVGGVNARPKEFPHMALVGYKKKNKIWWNCGGSLISNRHVLSAAHCSNIGTIFEAKWVRLGEYDVNSTKDDTTGLSRIVDIQIEEIINHPSYQNSQFYYDIAIYKLNKPVDFNEFVRPICLNNEKQLENTMALAIGWGHTQHTGTGSDALQKVNLTLTDNAACRENWGESRFLKNGVDLAQQMCAGDRFSGKGTCKGDSGGPLQIRLESPYCMYSLLGITSTAKQCGLQGPGLYTRVSRFVSWIEDIVWPDL